MKVSWKIPAMVLAVGLVLIFVVSRAGREIDEVVGVKTIGNELSSTNDPKLSQISVEQLLLKLPENLPSSYEHPPKPGVDIDEFSVFRELGRREGRKAMDRVLAKYGRTKFGLPAAMGQVIAGWAGTDMQGAMNGLQELVGHYEVDFDKRLVTFPHSDFRWNGAGLSPPSL